MKIKLFFLLLGLSASLFSCKKEDIEPYDSRFSIQLDGDAFSGEPSEIWINDLFLASREYLTAFVVTRASDDYQIQFDLPDVRAVLGDGKVLTEGAAEEENRVSVIIRRPAGNGSFDTFRSDTLNGSATMTIDRYDFEHGMEGSVEFSVPTSDSTAISGQNGSFSLTF